MADKPNKWRERREVPGGFGSVTIEERIVSGDKPSPGAVQVPDDTPAAGWHPLDVPQLPGIGA
jgi:hypothetical protein